MQVPLPSKIIIDRLARQNTTIKSRQVLAVVGVLDALFNSVADSFESMEVELKKTVKRIDDLSNRIEELETKLYEKK